MFSGNTCDEVKDLSNSILTARSPELLKQQIVATVILIYCGGYYVDGWGTPQVGDGGCSQYTMGYNFF
jgi:hypothetical protein